MNKKIILTQHLLFLFYHTITVSSFAGLIKKQNHKMSRQQAQAPKSTGAKPKQVNFNMNNQDLNFVFSEFFFIIKP